MQNGEAVETGRCIAREMKKVPGVIEADPGQSLGVAADPREEFPYDQVLGVEEVVVVVLVVVVVVEMLPIVAILQSSQP